MKPRSILWICSDQQRFDTLGCYGNRFVRTPNIDRLAERGVLFERAYCQNPLCTPSRASFLTGRYPSTVRCVQNGQSIPEQEVLVTRLLADAGYTCGLSGKLHLSACNPRACAVMERRIDDGYAEFHWSHHPTPDWPANEYTQWLCEQGEEFRRSPFPGCGHIRTGMPGPLHQTTWCAEKAIRFIEARADADTPWLFSVNMFDPHFPFDPPERLLQRYLDDLEDVPLPNYRPGELETKPEHQQNWHQGGPHRAEEMSERDHRLVRAAYWAMIDLIDEQVGRMLGALEAAGQAENTMVIFMSDHGEMLGDHGLYLKGRAFYEPAVRVPLIVSAPGAIQGGRRSRALVELVDLAPFLLEAAGLPVPRSMQGHSLLPLLSGGADLDHHRDDVYSEFHVARQRPKPGDNVTMLRTDRHKLVVVHGKEPGELYDLKADPTETDNRWDDPACRAVKVDLLRRLSDRMAETVDPLPAPTAPW